MCSQLYGTTSRLASPVEPKPPSVDHSVFVLAEILEDVVARQHGLPLRRPEIREHEAVALLERIPRLAHSIEILATGGLARLLEASPPHVE